MRSSPRVRAVGLLVGFACVVACTGQLATTASSNAGASLDASTEVDAGATAPGPYRITCSVYHRDLGDGGLPQHTREPLVFFTDAPGETSITLSEGEIPVHARLAPAADASDAVELTIEFPRSGLERRFVLGRNDMPPYELAGYHGFTGLNYVTTPGSTVDVQFICQASPRDQERPKPEVLPTGPSAPQPRPPRAPFRVECTTQVGEGADASTGGQTLDEAGTHRFTLAEHVIDVEMQDDPYEGRALVVVERILFPGGESYGMQQLYQLDPSHPVTDVTRGPGGLTGRTTLRLEPLVDGGAFASTPASFWCGAAPE